MYHLDELRKRAEDLTNTLFKEIEISDLPTGGTRGKDKWIDELFY